MVAGAFQASISPSCLICVAQRCAASGTLNGGERRKCSSISKSNVFTPQNPDVAKTIHFDGVFRRRRLDSRHVANDLTILLAKWFHHK
jgi:hypothetical protein